MRLIIKLRGFQIEKLAGSLASVNI